MRSVIAIDPGTRTGIAELPDWASPTLPATKRRGIFVATMTRIEAFAWLAERLRECDGATVLIEIPRVYPGGRSPNPQTLIAIAIQAGELAGLARSLGASVEFLEPMQWGGTAPKKIKHGRAQARLAAMGYDWPARTSEHSRDALGMLAYWLD